MSSLGKYLTWSVAEAALDIRSKFGPEVAIDVLDAQDQPVELTEVFQVTDQLPMPGTALAEGDRVTLWAVQDAGNFGIGDLYGRSFAEVQGELVRRGAGSVKQVGSLCRDEQCVDEFRLTKSGYVIDRPSSESGGVALAAGTWVSALSSSTTGVTSNPSEKSAVKPKTTRTKKSKMRAAKKAAAKPAALTARRNVAKPAKAISTTKKPSAKTYKLMAKRPLKKVQRKAASQPRQSPRPKTKPSKSKVSKKPVGKKPGAKRLPMQRKGKASRKKVRRHV